MFILLGKLVMLVIWVLMALNLVMPFTHPANIFINVALVFLCLVHGLQVWLYKSTMTADEKNNKVLWGIFFFGLFEALSWRNKPVE